MEWFKMSSRLYTDPDIFDLSDAAFRTWVLALAYCADHETDGLYRLLGRKPRAIDELVERGRLVHLDGDRYSVVGWDKWQRSKAELEQKRAEARDRVNRSRSVRANKVRTKPVTEREHRRTEVEVEVEEELQTQHLAPRASRDALFEAVAEACDIDWHDLTPSARGALNKAVAQLKGVGATPDEVRRRASNWPYDVVLTPPGLAKHWPRLGKAHSQPDKRIERMMKEITG